MDESDDRVIKRLEAMHLMDPDKWEHIVNLAGNAVIHEAVDNGTGVEFVKQVNAYRKSMGLEPVDRNFHDAMHAFKDMLEDIQAVGVRETLAFLRRFASDVNGEIMDKEDEVKPAALKVQVGRQLDYLLGGLLVPQKEEDQMLVRFMAADREARNDMLQHTETRQVLFRAIRAATEQYPQVYEKLFRNIPDDPSKLKFSPRIRKPTYHDRAAQLQALIILGKQARVVVENLNRSPDHRDSDFGAEIDGATLPEDPTMMRTGLRFKPATRRNARYLSDLHRSGFNTRDLFFKIGKIAGAFTVLANVAQSWGEAGQNSADFADRIMKTVELTATNHAALAGAAVTVGAHMAERDPRVLKWPWLSQHEKEDVKAALRLDNLQARLGHQTLRRFLNNGAEWQAMNHHAMDASTIKQLLKGLRNPCKRMNTIGDRINGITWKHDS
jgi:hypothetical protein